jgi:hypothetical protein
VREVLAIMLACAIAMIGSIDRRGASPAIPQREACAVVAFCSASGGIIQCDDRLLPITSSFARNGARINAGDRVLVRFSAAASWQTFHAGDGAAGGWVVEPFVVDVVEVLDGDAGESRCDR